MKELSTWLIIPIAWSVAVTSSGPLTMALNPRCRWNSEVFCWCFSHGAYRNFDCSSTRKPNHRRNGVGILSEHSAIIDDECFQQEGWTVKIFTSAASANVHQPGRKLYSFIRSSLLLDSELGAYSDAHQSLLIGVMCWRVEKNERHLNSWCMHFHFLLQIFFLSSCSVAKKKEISLSAAWRSAFFCLIDALVKRFRFHCLHW